MSAPASPILTQSVPKLFFTMAMPIILGLMVSGLYTFVDAIFISRAVGTDAIGGVSAAFPIHMLMISISTMLGSGMASIISRRLGANEDLQASKVFSASLQLSLLVGVSVSVLLFLLRETIFSLMNTPAALLPYAMEYITPIACYGLISFSYGTLSENFRAQGKNVLVMQLMALSAVMNVGLDALFLFVFEWGVEGAAWATVLAISISLVFALIMFNKGEYRVQFLWRYFSFIPAIHKEAMSLGLPIFLSYLGFALMLVMVNLAIANVAGSDAQLLISAHGIFNRTFMLIFLPVLGMMIAFQTFAGFNYGAQQYARVKQGLKVAIWYSSVYGLLWTVFMLTRSHWLFQLFTTDQVLIDAAVSMSEVFFMAYAVVGVRTICPALFQALGFAKPAIILNALHNYFLLLPALWFCSVNFGVAGIWLTFPVVDIIGAIIIGFYTSRYINKLVLKKDTTQYSEGEKKAA